MNGPKGLSPPGNIDPRLKQLLDGLAEKTEVGAGERGNPLDRYIKIRDLIDLGYAKVLGRVGQRLVSGNNLVSTDAPDLSIPPKPTGFEVFDGFDHVFLEWDPPLKAYSNHAFTEIYRNTTDNLSNAVLVATSTSFAWADLNVQYGVTYYYWIRFRSVADIVGPFNDTVGTPGQSAQDPAELLARLSGQITETELYADLNARIDLIDGPDSLTGSVAQRILQEAIDRAAAIAAEATARDAAIASAVSYLETYADDDSASAVLLDQLITVFGGNVANALTYTVAEVDSDLAVSTTFTSLQAQITALDGDLASYASITYVDEAVADESTARASAIAVVQTEVDGNTAAIATQATSISGLEAKYTVKIDVNGHVAGYGLAVTSNDYDDEIHSTMLFSVDTFAIASPGATTMSFVVDSGSVVMSGAFIQDATITDAKIQTLSVEKVTGLDATFLQANIGTLYVDNIEGDVNKLYPALNTTPVDLRANIYTHVVTNSVPSQTRPRYPVMFAEMDISSSSTYASANLKIALFRFFSSAGSPVWSTTTPASVGPSGGQFIFDSASRLLYEYEYPDTDPEPSDPAYYANSFPGTTTQLVITVATGQYYVFGGLLSKSKTPSSVAPGIDRYTWYLNFSWGFAINVTGSPTFLSKTIQGWNSGPPYEMIDNDVSTVNIPINASDINQLSKVIVKEVATAAADTYYIGVRSSVADLTCERSRCDVMMVR